MRKNQSVVNQSEWKHMNRTILICKTTDSHFPYKLIASVNVLDWMPGTLMSDKDVKDACLTINVILLPYYLNDESNLDS